MLTLLVSIFLFCQLLLETNANGLTRRLTSSSASDSASAADSSSDSSSSTTATTTGFDGRPYNLLHINESLQVTANMIISDGDKCNINDKYINTLLSEHASIASFNKFSIELMNLGVPLWMVELSQKAGLDEINHTKIMLNIINNNDENNKCVQIGKFPNHEIQIDSDCNKVAMDVAKHCIGETISSITAAKKSNILASLYSVAIDEVRHSSLEWIAVKWMINNCQQIKVSQDSFWDNKFTQFNLTHTSHEKQVIKTIFDIFWNFKGENYHNLYQTIHDTLLKEVKSVAPTPLK